jgi:hypothetical protein
MTGTGSITPMVDATSYNLLTASYQTSNDNYYISRTVEGVPAYNTVRLIYDTELPAGCSIVPEYSVDGGITWYACADNPSTIFGVDEGMNRHEFSRDITLDGLGPTETSFKTRIKVHNGGNAFVTPVVKNLKWIMKNV